MVRKLIAFILICTVTFTTVPGVYAQSAVHTTQAVLSQNNPLAKLTFAATTGSIDQTFVGDSDVNVVLIKDAHCNYDAQINQADILRTLFNEYGFTSIYVEGACDDVDTTLFTAYPNSLAKEHILKTSL